MDLERRCRYRHTWASSTSTVIVMAAGSPQFLCAEGYFCLRSKKRSDLLGITPKHLLPALEYKKTDEAVKKALESRNANDNFQQGQVNDYDTGSPEEILERDEIKGGTGQRGKARNRNDDFNED